MTARIIELNKKYNSIENFYKDEIENIIQKTNILEEETKNLKEILTQAVIDLSNDDNHVTNLRAELKNKISMIELNNSNIDKLKSVDSESEKEEVLNDIQKHVSLYVPTIYKIVQENCKIQYINDKMKYRNYKDDNKNMCCRNETLELLKLIYVNDELNINIKNKCIKVITVYGTDIFKLFLYLYLSKYTDKFNTYIRDKIEEIIYIKYTEPCEYERRDQVVSYTMMISISDYYMTYEFDDDNDEERIYYYEDEEDYPDENGYETDWDEIIETFVQKDDKSLLNLFTSFMTILNIYQYNGYNSPPVENDLIFATKRYIKNNKEHISNETEKEIAYMIYDKFY